MQDQNALVLMDMAFELKRLTGKDYDELGKFIAEVFNKIQKEDPQLVKHYVENISLFNEVMAVLIESIISFFKMTAFWGVKDPKVGAALENANKVFTEVIEENKAWKSVDSLQPLKEQVENILKIVNNSKILPVEHVKAMNIVGNNILVLIDMSEEINQRISEVMDTITKKYGPEAALAFEISINTQLAMKADSTDKKS